MILARHPNLTPDQVMGALMASAVPVPNAPVGSVGVGEIQMNLQGIHGLPAKPEQGARQVPRQRRSRRREDLPTASGWYDAAKSSVSWDSVSVGLGLPGRIVSWNDVSWADVSWSDVSLGGRRLGETSPGRIVVLERHLLRGRGRKATRAATRTGTSSPRSRRRRSWPIPTSLPRGHAPGGGRKRPRRHESRQAHRRTGRFPVPSGPGNR